MAISCTVGWGEAGRQISHVQVALGLETDAGAVDQYIVAQGAAGCSNDHSVNGQILEHCALSHADVLFSSWRW